MEQEDITDGEKSVLLAKAMGWIMDDSTEPMDWRDEKGEEIPMTLVANIMSKGYAVGFSFYDPANMALAWRIHLWALKVKRNNIKSRYWDWWNLAFVWGNPDAQRLWLDKILDLAIEAKLVEVKNDTSYG